MANFTLPEEAQLKSDLVTWASQAAMITPDQVQAWIEQQAATAPAGTCDEVGATTAEQKAWVAMTIATGNNLPANPGQAKPKSTRKATSQPVSTLDAGQTAALAAHVQNTFKQKANLSNNSRIEKFFVARPASEEYIDAGTTGAIKAESWKSIQDKIKSGEYVVVEDFKNKDGQDVLSKTNYDILAKAAADKAENVLVMRSGSIGASIGYQVNVAEGPDAHGDEQIYTKENMKHFVEMKGAGYIVATSDTLGVVLKTATVKNAAANQPDSKRVVLSDTNKKAAVEAKNYLSIRDVEPTKSKKTQKSDLVFYVTKKVVKTGEDGKTTVTDQDVVDQKGKVRRYAIRASVECLVHDLTVKKQYEGVFPTGKVDPTKPLTGESLKKAAEATIADLAVTLSDTNNAVSIDQSLAADLEELKKIIAGSNNGGSDQF